jgi:hypothetical protein
MDSRRGALIMATYQSNFASSLFIGNDCVSGIKAGSSGQRSRSRLHGLCIAGLISMFASSAASAANGSVAYTYNSLGRLTTASYDTGVCLVHTYDAGWSPANRDRKRRLRWASMAMLHWGAANWQ